MNIKDYQPKERFTNRVENYVKYRPNYPQDIVNVLKNSYSLTKDSVIADIGSGTGIFTKLLLQNDFTVFGIEPNSEMRRYAENDLVQYKKYKSIKGSAEHTTLNNDIVDAITVAQAFHWFNVDSAILEFQRILKTNGIIALVWNEREVDIDQFHKKYEQALITYCTDYKVINHANFTREKINLIFNEKIITQHHFKNQQELDLKSLIGRLESSSYCPDKSDKNYSSLMEIVEILFRKYNNNGRIIINYNCIMYCIR